LAEQGRAVIAILNYAEGRRAGRSFVRM